MTCLASAQRISSRFSSATIRARGSSDRLAATPILGWGGNINSSILAERGVFFIAVRTAAMVKRGAAGSSGVNLVRLPAGAARGSFCCDPPSLQRQLPREGKRHHSTAASTTVGGIAGDTNGSSLKANTDVRPLVGFVGDSDPNPDVAPTSSPATAVDAAQEAYEAVPDFNDARSSYSSFTTWELFRAYAVLRACAIRPMVDNSEALLKLGYRTIGENLTNSILGKTFFAHFCAGETAEEVGGRVAALRSLGVGGILDYAAEVDLRPAKEREEREAKRRAAGDDRLLREEPAQCRTYDYMGEPACDTRAQTFLTCINAVRDQTPGGFAAVKLSALGDPVLLSQLSTCVHLVRGLFEDFDHDKDGVVSRQEFEAGYNRWFRPLDPINSDTNSDQTQTNSVESMGHLLHLAGYGYGHGDDDGGDEGNAGGIDYVEWSNGMRLDNLAEITANCLTPGPLAAAALKEDGLALNLAMQDRIRTLSRAAAEAEVRLLIDAEQSWLQPAIDNTVYGLQREFNKNFPSIYTTYQCYLKDALERLSTDLDRAARGGYVWAGKLVRGAYMVSERARAKDEGRESPVFETIEDTHACYDAAITMVLEHIAMGNRAEVMIATHNQASIEHAIRSMQKLNIPRGSGVSFGQLLGMADNITFPLGTRGYKAYKYIPYGKVGETIPYLLRRAQENSDMLGGAKHERGLLLKEIRRRLTFRHRS